MVALVPMNAVILLLSQIQSSKATSTRPSTSHLTERETAMCGDNPSFHQCGAPFPDDFCCPASATCLQLESTALVVLCCPAGQDCKFVSPINCDQTAQNAAMSPTNQLHSDPTMPLEQCGDACCPVGATCHSGVCEIQTAAPVTSTGPAMTSSASRATSTSEASATSSATTSQASSVPNTSDSLDGIPINDGVHRQSSNNFSGTSFVAGFLPGILLGIIAFALLMWCLSRRKKRRYDSDSEKHFSTADQLTSLSADPDRPPMHTRSISEPVSDLSSTHRTDFVRGTPSPPRPADPYSNVGYTATISGPATPSRTQKPRTFLSRSSIFQTPPTPLPTHFPPHLKRGTLTHAYTIAPIPTLRSKKSSHSLRRERDAAATAAPHSQPHPTTQPSTTTETIQVLLPRAKQQTHTPDQRKAPPPIHLTSPSTWDTSRSSPLYPEPIRSHHTPTRVPAAQARRAEPAARAYEQGLFAGRIGDDDGKRMTTFSGFMERAGVRAGQEGSGGGGGRRV